MSRSETNPPERKARARGRLDAEFGFVLTTLRRFSAERIPVIAASLSYTSLLALVPLLAIGVSVLSAFPAFAGIEKRLIELMLAYGAPFAGSEVQAYLDQFVANTSKLTAVGVVWLAVTAILLLSTIESAFNAIWRAEAPRPVLTRLIAYWTTLTLGPLLIGAGLSLSTVLFAVGSFAALGVEMDLGPARSGLLGVLPFLFAAIGFTVLYLALPHRRVAWRHAVLGGVVAALLFEGLKGVFGFYVANVGTLQSVYGSLLALPVFLIWMYLAWAVVLFGGVVAATRPEWLAARSAEAFGPLTRSRQLLRALQVLAALFAAGRQGHHLDNETLLETVGGDGEALARVMARLGAAGYIARTDDDAAVLARDLDGVEVYDVYRALGFGIAPDEAVDAEEAPWAATLQQLLAATEAGDREALGRPVKELFAAAHTPHLVPDATGRVGD